MLTESSSFASPPVHPNHQSKYVSTEIKQKSSCKPQRTKSSSLFFRSQFYDQTFARDEKTFCHRFVISEVIRWIFFSALHKSHLRSISASNAHACVKYCYRYASKKIQIELPYTASASTTPFQ